jgi:hypothetical protein
MKSLPCVLLITYYLLLITDDLSTRGLRSCPLPLPGRHAQPSAKKSLQKVLKKLKLTAAYAYALDN